MKKNKLFKGLLIIQILLAMFGFPILFGLSDSGHLFLEDMPSWFYLFAGLYSLIFFSLLGIFFFSKGLEVARHKSLVTGVILIGAVSVILSMWSLPIFTLLLSFISIGGLIFAFVILRRNERK